jgi:hypothetical protein
MRNYPKLSWKSTTCDAWPALPIDLNRTAGGFATAPFAADLIPKISMNKPYLHPNITIMPHIFGTATKINSSGRGETLICFAEIFGLDGISPSQKKKGFRYSGEGDTLWIPDFISRRRSWLDGFPSEMPSPIFQEISRLCGASPYRFGI